MAIGWLTVLQAVPWSDVISNAPKVAEGAKKLWSTVSKKSATPTPAAANSTTATASPPAQALAVLESRVAALEASAAQAHEQLVASSELIKALAEQNAQLIQRIDISRVRLMWLAGLALLGAVTGVVSVMLLLAPG